MGGGSTAKCSLVISPPGERPSARGPLVGCKLAAFAGHFGETLGTADGGDSWPIVHALLDVFLQLAAFFAAIQDADVHWSGSPLIERVHVTSPRVRLRRRQRRYSRPSSAVLPMSDHRGATRLNLLRSCSSWPSQDTEAVAVNGLAIRVRIQPGHERVLVGAATDIDPALQNA